MGFEFNELAKDIWQKKHFSTQDSSIDDVFKRVSTTVASIETNKELWEQKFYNVLSSMKLIAGGRIYNGAGTDNNYLLNCFVEPIPDSLEGIMEATKRSAMIFKKNGGVGYSFASLRPKDFPLTKGGTSSGSVSFMKLFDAAGETIKSGGHARRAAQIAILPCDHADIEEFIDAKRTDGVLSNFNISVGITDEFIDAVKNDLDWNLVWEDKIIKTVKAKYLWDKFIKSQYNHNDPGFLNLSEVNKYNNMYYEYDLHATNPCITPETLILTNKGWIEIQHLTSKFEKDSDIKIITTDKNNVLSESKLHWCGITTKDDTIYKVSFDNGEYLLTNDSHKFLDKNMTKHKVRNINIDDNINIKTFSGETTIIDIEKTTRISDVYDLTCTPNFNFFSLLNREEDFSNKKIIVNDCIEFFHYDLVSTHRGKIFAKDLVTDDELI